MNDAKRSRRRFPDWLKKRIPHGKKYASTLSCLSENRVHTVCTEARCPNRSECFSEGTATFLIMGDRCTRNCAFCGVRHGTPCPLDSYEPCRIASAAKKMGLRHIVITSVTRDDLPDGGASHFAVCVRKCSEMLPEAPIEILIPDFRGDRRSLELAVSSGPAILGHNVETVPRLYPHVRPAADYRRSLGICASAHAFGITVKSSIMAGLGETDDEILAVLEDLRTAGCSMVTIGQYLQPSDGQMPPQRFVTPERFRYYEAAGRVMGFSHIASGPFVRSSYRAQEAALSLAIGRRNIVF